MKKTAIATLTTLILGAVQAEYFIKQPLEQAQGGFLSNNSVNLIAPPPNIPKSCEPHVGTFQIQELESGLFNYDICNTGLSPYCLSEYYTATPPHSFFLSYNGYRYYPNISQGAIGGDALRTYYAICREVE